nr:cache domain-containing protein [Hankyongella ginsenosidimutans]
MKDGKLVVGDNYVVNDNFEVVDRVKELVGGTATVFQGDMRVSTNVKSRTAAAQSARRWPKTPPTRRSSSRANPIAGPRIFSAPLLYRL